MYKLILMVDMNLEKTIFIIQFDERKGKKMGKTQITEQEINAVIDLYRKLTPERKATYLAHLRKLDADTPAPAQAVQETSCEE